MNKAARFASQPRYIIVSVFSLKWTLAVPASWQEKIRSMAAARLIFICFVHLKSLSIQCWFFLYSGRSCRCEYKFTIKLMKLLALNIVGRGTSPFWCSSAWSQRFSCSNQEGTKQPLLAATFDYNYHITETCTKSVKLRGRGKLQKHAWQIKSIKTSTHVNFNILLHTPSKNTISPIAACGKSTPEASPQQKRSVPPMLREERRLLPCYSHSLWTLYGILCLYLYLFFFKKKSCVYIYIIIIYMCVCAFIHSFIYLFSYSIFIFLIIYLSIGFV